jgi:hypothetical protein
MLGQGYLFARPLAPEAISQRIGQEAAGRVAADAGTAQLLVRDPA